MGVLVLYETSAGFCLFRLTEEGKWKDDNVWKSFQSPDQASNLVKLQSIHRFASTADAVEDITAISEGKLSKSLKKFLVDEVSGAAGGEEGSSKKSKGKGKSKGAPDSLLVIDPKLGGAISKKLSIPVISEQTSKSFNDLYRGIRSQLATLLTTSDDDEVELDERDLQNMNLGLSHSLSRFKLKFSTDKVDVMVVQAVSLLDELDKEINVYAMRVKEWYGWHFPEMGKIIIDNQAYAKCVLAMGYRTTAASTDFSTILPEELEATLKTAATLSMGTEISASDLTHIQSLCTQLLSLTSYRTELSEYLRNRMSAIAPNLTALVGDLVGARLIAHAGSLVQLAKAPASTVQILGAEKALFRALKTKSDTPKYGLIFHAGLVGQAPPKLKGKMARMVSTKTSLSVRLDALADSETKSSYTAGSVGLESRTKLEARLRALESGLGLTSLRAVAQANGAPKTTLQGNGAAFNTNGDTLLPAGMPGKGVGGGAMEVDGDEAESPKKSKKEKKEKKDKKRRRSEVEEEDAAAGDVSTASALVADGDEDEADRKERKRRKKEKKAAEAAAAAAADGTNGVEVETDGAAETPSKKEKKEKKKRKSEA